MLNKLVIVGVGLIGGSFALALRKAGIVKHIVGVGRSHKNMKLALEHGVIDEIADDLRFALDNADFVLLAMPVGQTENILMQISPHLQSHTIICDVGSTKQDVVAAARSKLGKNLKNFVPGHPIAGTEQSGILAAQENLYVNKHVLLTPIDETSPDAIQETTHLWQACGAKVSQMDVTVHDVILAMTSHLPHILAFALINHSHHFTSRAPHEMPKFAGSSFLDFTRLASSSAEMWHDICISNREELLKQIKAYQSELSKIQFILKNKDADALQIAFTQARDMRKFLMKNN